VQSHNRVLRAGCLFFVLACGIQGWSQSTTEIRGRVQDRSGHTVTSAFVIITAQDTSLMRAATSDDAGEFSLPSLPVGVYSLQVKAEGFADFDSKDIRASIGEVVRLNITLAPPGSENCHALDLGMKSLVETGNAQLGVVMSAGEVTQLPLKSRDTFELLQLQPGVQSTLGTNLFFGSDRPGVVSVSGARTRSNNFEVNGGYSADQMVNSPSVQPSPDSISEFRVISHNYEAALGHNSGSVLNVVTKSGGSTWHGTAYEFLRNNDLNAKGYFDPAVPDFKQNEFGGTLGGPVRRDKTFFFGSYEGRRQRRGITSSRFRCPAAPSERAISRVARHLQAH
jgi:hypothetical protein